MPEFSSDLKGNHTCIKDSVGIGKYFSDLIEKFIKILNDNQNKFVDNLDNCMKKFKDNNDEVLKHYKELIKYNEIEKEQLLKSMKSGNVTEKQNCLDRIALITSEIGSLNQKVLSN
jgi:hypothetical protein